ncbi:hypothetical protein J2X57_000005 [Luteibacter sp. 1214]|uniref:hypothetical protein n=1 Tax=Luteibacter sp. 1214 TaxID=2817735 RepID=UPI002865147E|nr:hypothetical protein [Luteibacter sp. 1214]MDR6640811.1 hypothetical protein [Luteibacter sp. 1214]
MRTARVLLMTLAVSLPLTGCYYDPGYGYVRNGSGGDAYYGEETTTTIVDPGYGYYDNGYGYGPGCCYSGVTVGAVWYDYGGRRYYRGRDGNYFDRDGHRGPPPGRGDRRPPPGGWHGGDDDHRPPGGWQGGNRPGGWQGGRPGGDRPGGWQGGRPGGDRPGGWQGQRPPQNGGAGGGNRPPPPGGWHGGDRPAGGNPNAHPPGQRMRDDNGARNDRRGNRDR